MYRKTIFAALLLVPTQTMACDLDGILGYGGAHRYNPFSGARSAPMPQADPDQQRQADMRSRERAERREQPDRVKQREEREARRARDGASGNSEPIPPRKWDVEGGAPVSAEAKATFT